VISTEEAKMNLYGDEHDLVIQEEIKPITQPHIDSIKEQLVQSAPIAKIGNIQKYFKIQKQIKAALDEAIKLADENKIRLYQMAQSQLASGKTTLGDDAAFNDLVDTVDSINIVATMHDEKPEQAEPKNSEDKQNIYDDISRSINMKLSQAITDGNEALIEAYEQAKKKLSQVTSATQITSISEQMLKTVELASNNKPLDSLQNVSIANVIKYAQMKANVKNALDNAMLLGDLEKVKLYQEAYQKLESGVTSLSDNIAFSSLVSTIESIDTKATEIPDATFAEPEVKSDNQLVYDRLNMLVQSKLDEANANGDTMAAAAYEIAQKQLSFARSNIADNAVMENLKESISIVYTLTSGEKLDIEQLKIVENVIDASEPELKKQEAIIEDAVIVEDENTNDSKNVPPISENEDQNIDFSNTIEMPKPKKLDFGSIFIRDITETDTFKDFERTTELGFFDTNVKSIKDKIEGDKIVSTKSSFLNYQYGKSYTEDQYGAVHLNSEFSGKTGLVGFKDRARGIQYVGDNTYEQKFDKVNYFKSLFREEETLVKENGAVVASEYQQDVGFGFLKFNKDKVEGVERSQTKIGNVFGCAAYKNISTQVSHDTGSMKSSENKLFGLFGFEDTKIESDTGSYRQKSLSIGKIKLTFTRDKESGTSGINLNLFGNQLDSNGYLSNVFDKKRKQFQGNIECTKGVYGNFINNKNNLTPSEKVDYVTNKFAQYGHSLVDDKRAELLDQTDPKIIPMTNTKNTSKMQA
jgi:hypothetical protein